MKKWRRATGAIKDKLSLITATDEKFTAAIIKSTSHNDLSIDIENIQFIYKYIQSNPSSFKPIIRAISSRVKHTRNWTVALKCLMLLHGFFFLSSSGNNKTVNSIGRLPFDLSGFGKKKSRFSRTGRFNIFIRAYFSFLDERSILFYNDHEKNHHHQLETIVKMQRLIDLLMRIKPIVETFLVIEAMEYVISEILEIYGQICHGFEDFLASNIPAKSPETMLAMKIVMKSLSQGEELFRFFEFCKGLGVIMNIQEIPNFVRITESQVIMLDKLLRRSNVPEFERSAKITPVTAADMAETDLVSKPSYDNCIPDLISF